MKKELLDITKLTRAKLAELFSCQPKTITDWVKLGLPRRNDKLYNLKRCIKWLLDYERKKAKPSLRADVEIEKIRKQSEKLELEIQERLGKSIPRDKVLEMQYKQAEELMNFLTDGYKKNGQLMCKRLGIPIKKLPQFYEIWDEYIKAAMNAFVRGGSKIDT